MKRLKSCRSILLIGATLLSIGGGLSAQAQPQLQDETARDAAENAPDTPGDGPYPAIIETDPSLPEHVIYRPANLLPFAGGKLPVVGWGNGGCYDDGTANRQYLAQIASYGYLVIAPGLWRSGPNAKAGPLQPPPIVEGEDLPRPPTDAQDVMDGIEWAVAEDKRERGRLRGMIDREALAVGGHSCGGLLAIQLAADPRIATVMVNNSGTYDPEGRGITGIEVSKDLLRRFHTPVIYFMGGAQDVAYQNGLDDFERVDHVPIIFAELPVGHEGTFDQPMGGAVAHAAVDWLEWQLRRDKVAARTFLGENCRLCTGTEWSLRMKGF